MPVQQELPLSLSPEPGTVFINDGRCRLRIEGDQRVIVLAGVPIHHYVVGDRTAEAYARASPSRDPVSPDPSSNRTLRKEGRSGVLESGTLERGYA